MLVRLSKIALVLAVSGFFLLIAWNNVADYDSNFTYIQHVLSMDTVLPESLLQWRAIHSLALQHVCYRALIVSELSIGLTCLVGAYQLWANLGATGTVFDQQKAIAILGLTLGILLWFVGFMVIGGEWFVMWQSEQWNGQQPAFRFLVSLGLVLLFVHTPEPKPEP